ncbi:hypothetical protein C8J57DRAFT_1396570 [Mycena rebaudengoi]|nr:hypothetical protein C8J57DRAFT_1396570 [Mycena rebaudengoi]
MGIRYTAAPIGDLHFWAPQPPANVTGVQQAMTQPNQCFQAASGVSPTNPLRACAAQMSAPRQLQVPWWQHIYERAIFADASRMRDVERQMYIYITSPKF